MVQVPEFLIVVIVVVVIIIIIIIIQPISWSVCAVECQNYVGWFHCWNL